MALLIPTNFMHRRNGLTWSPGLAKQHLKTVVNSHIDMMHVV